MADRYLAGMLAFLRRDELASAEAVRITTGGETCDGLFDDEEVIVSDGLGTSVQETQTVVRIAEGIITRPASNAVLTVTAQDGTATAYQVREVRKDPQQPGMWRVQVARA